MSEQAKIQPQINAARAYANLMVPALFGEWAVTVADAAEVRRGQRVLDIACGTGVLTRQVKSRTGASGRVVGLDPNEGMLEVAKTLAPDIEWQQGVAESIPFSEHSFDSVVSQFGLMFFRDRVQAVREMLRVLAGKGRFAVAVWDSLENIPAYAAVVDLLERLAGTAAADALRAPFVLGHRHELQRLFEDAGAAAGIRTVRGTARFPSVRVMVEADLRGWLPIMGVVLPEDQIAHILGAAEEVLKPYVASDGKAVFATSAHIISGAAAV